MIVIYSLIALFIAWIWVDYFRLIDIYDQDELKNFIAAFLIGGLSIPITIVLHLGLVSPLGLELNGNPLNDLIFSVYGVGLIEESAKLLSFLIFYRFFKKHITEPFDYLSYSATAALGFAAIENISYFNSSGGGIVFGRAVLSTILHMMCTVSVVYGYLVFKYGKRKGQSWVLIFFFLLAVLQHGLYDFFLFELSWSYALYLAAIYMYLISISAFATMLNNGLNQSKFYSHHKVIDSSRIAFRLLKYYGIVFGLQIAVTVFLENSKDAVAGNSLTFFSSGALAFIASVRLSRFRLIPGKWLSLKFELPVGYVKPPPFESNRKSYFSIRGEAYNEAEINKYFEDTAWMRPVSSFNWIFKPSSVQIYVEDKLFLDYDETYYLVRVYASGHHEAEWKSFVIKPKMTGTTKMSDEYPIVALLNLPKNWLDTRVLKRKDLEFVHWVYLKPIEE